MVIRRHTLSRLLLTALATGCLFQMGCRSGPRPGTDAPVPPPVEVVEHWNERAERLDRLWGRVAVTFRFTDQDGRRRFEQGEGHFQLLDGAHLALSVGKLSEVMLWIGSDETRYWLIERFEQRRAWFGAHESFTRAKGERIGLPIAPRELLVLMGLAPLDPDADWTTSRTKSGATLLTIREPNSASSWRAELAPDTRLPETVELLDADGAVILRAEHTVVRPAIIRYERSSDFDHIARAISISYPAADASLTINFDAELFDGRRTGRPRRNAFNLEGLLNALGPMDEVVDLDASVAMP
ncbi:MAG: hypothetical protein EA380_06480 [Phycisphaeraceae bacterium]|nr:MAG: hypothetical protein EA380_06480 [Phycisphaeraceae bacterium]